jgi:hypothetical protein
MQQTNIVSIAFSGARANLDKLYLEEINILDIFTQLNSHYWRMDLSAKKNYERCSGRRLGARKIHSQYINTPDS